MDPLGSKCGKSWFYAAVGKPGVCGISTFLVIKYMLLSVNWDMPILVFNNLFFLLYLNCIYV